jgi:hypothetical protein
MAYQILNIINMIVIWPLGFWLLWQQVGWRGCIAVFLLLFANNIQMYPTKGK